MNIKEYIKIQASECQHEVMKTVFVSLKNRFFPEPIVPTKSLIVNDKEPNIKKTISKDDMFKRKVVVNLGDNKRAIGLVDKDGYDITLANKDKLEFKMISENHTFYYGYERLFYRENNSRIVNMIDSSNYQRFYSDICWVKDYALEDNEKVRIY